MKVKRLGVFETNSSSMHSFTLGNNADLKTIVPNEDGEIYIHFGEYGWSQETYYEPIDMASYMATYLFNKGECDNEKKEYVNVININEEGNYVGNNEKILQFINIIKDHTGAEQIIFEKCSGFYPYGYIDHQSHDVAEEMCEDMLNSIFGGGILKTDNDNH